MLVFIGYCIEDMRYTYNIFIIILFFSFILSQEEWNMTITIDDIQNVGAFDQIVLVTIVSFNHESMLEKMNMICHHHQVIIQIYHFLILIG